MSNLAHQLPAPLTIAHKALQPTNSDLMRLLIAVNYDKTRIVIADHELSDHFLTLYLEDANNPVEDISSALMYKLPVSKFAKIIQDEGYNSYEGVLYTNDGRAYDGRIEIDKPIAWYNGDATLYQQQCVLETTITHILKSITC